MTDGAKGMRSLVASVAPTLSQPTLDWFHLVEDPCGQDGTWRLRDDTDTAAVGKRCKRRMHCSDSVLFAWNRHRPLHWHRRVVHTYIGSADASLRSGFGCSMPLSSEGSHTRGQTPLRSVDIQ
jgi:hypothetical protein